MANMVSGIDIDPNRCSSLPLIYEIAHLPEQLSHVGKPQFGVARPAVLPECMKLAHRDPVALERVGLGVERFHDGKAGRIASR